MQRSRSSRFEQRQGRWARVLHVAWNALKLHRKYLLFQASAAIVAAVLLAIVVPLFWRVMMPQRRLEQDMQLVAFAGLKSNWSLWSQYLPETGRPVDIAEKAKVGSWRAGVLAGVLAGWLACWLACRCWGLAEGGAAMRPGLPSPGMAERRAAAG
jgi:fluoride ion exporter CrcB/FEX